MPSCKKSLSFLPIFTFSFLGGTKPDFIGLLVVYEPVYFVLPFDSEITQICLSVNFANALRYTKQQLCHHV